MTRQPTDDRATVKGGPATVRSDSLSAMQVVDEDDRITDRVRRELGELRKAAAQEELETKPAPVTRLQFYEQVERLAELFVTESELLRFDMHTFRRMLVHVLAGIGVGVLLAVVILFLLLWPAPPPAP